MHDHVRRLHASADLSEGQVAHLLGVDLIAAREILQTPNPCGATGPDGAICERERTHPPGIHWGPVADGDGRRIWKDTARCGERCLSTSIAADGGPVRCDLPVGHHGPHAADYSGPMHHVGDLIHEWTDEHATNRLT